MSTDNQQLTQANLRALMAGGAKVVRLARKEKRPLGRRWQELATADPVTVEEWIGGGHNVGLLLGPESGLIDVETDCYAGEALARELRLDHIDGAGATPTWQSRRGTHRLYRWAPWMPAVAELNLSGLEVRIGGRPAQSVLPPSVHPTGMRYLWQIRPYSEGGKPWVADVPGNLRELIEAEAAVRAARRDKACES